MNRRGVWFNVLAVLALSGVLVGALWLLVGGRSGVVCRGLLVEVADSASVRFVRQDQVVGWLDSAGVRVVGVPLVDLDLMAIHRVIEAQPYVAGVRTHATMRGDVHVFVRQYLPMVRVVSETGYDFYADTLGHIIPTSGHAPHDVPLVTGRLYFSFLPEFFGTLAPKKAGSDVAYLKNLINFVQFIETDLFLKGLVAQVYVLPDRSVELWGRTSGQVIEVGGLDDWQEKLHKMADFFRSAPRDVALGRPCRLVIKYRDQIIVKYDG